MTSYKNSGKHSDHPAVVYFGSLVRVYSAWWKVPFDNIVSHKPAMAALVAAACDLGKQLPKE